MIEVTAAVMMRDGRVLVARRKAGERHAGKWEFPGGKIEPGETPEACLRRELAEEFHIEVEVGALFGESTFAYEHGVVRLLAYHVCWQAGDLTLVDHDECRWLAPAELAGLDLLPADRPLAERLAAEASHG